MIIIIIIKIAKIKMAHRNMLLNLKKLHKMRNTLISVKTFRYSNPKSVKRYNEEGVKRSNGNWDDFLIEQYCPLPLCTLASLLQVI